MTPDIILPKKARKIVFALFGLLGLALGAAAVWFSSVGDPIPSWLIRSAAVDAFVTSAPLFLAVLNINKDVSDDLFKSNVNADAGASADQDIQEDVPVDEQVDDQGAGLDVVLSPKQ